MTNAKTVESRVKEFHASEGFGRTPADAFPPWWLVRRFEISPSDATRRSSDGAGDKGIDAYWVASDAARGPVLHLVQAKMTGSRTALRDAFRGFDKAMPLLATLLRGEPLERLPENPLWARLAAELTSNAQLRESPRISFDVIHLCEQDEQLLDLELKAAREAMIDAAKYHLPDAWVHAELFGPAQMLEAEPPAVAPSERQRIRFDGVPCPKLENAHGFSGFAPLADLVALFEKFGEQLFSRNVRYYIHRAVEQGGPAKHMRDTLRTMCVSGAKSTENPGAFAMYHNGVTLHATSAEHVDGMLVVRNPSVLNGCQTVKNSYYFHRDPKIRDRLLEDRWQEIRVPLRVVVTADQEFVRRVTVSNNRQTEIRPSAFYANDPAQIRLGDRFAEAGIYYERQEGAFDNIRSENPQEFEREYPNSDDAPLRMEDLAQAIAAVDERFSLSTAASVAKLFEDSNYEHVFSTPKLGDLRRLTFLRNLFRVVPAALKDLRERSSKLDRLPVARMRFPVTRVLARYAARYEDSLIEEWGAGVIKSAGPRHAFRQKLVRLMHSSHTGLQTMLPELWWDAKQQAWLDGRDKQTAVRALRKLKLDAVDIFALERD